MKSSRNITVKESVAIFLYICGHIATQRSVMRMFGHSQESIFRKFHEVLDVMELMAIDMFKPDPMNLTQVHRKVQSYRQYGSNFKGCIGVMDGSNFKGCIGPYRQARYHHGQFQNQAPPSNYKEKFNCIHSSIRSVIERTFGVWKGKWRIMQDRARYDIQTTRKLVAATMTLHNFVRKSTIPDPDFEANWEQGDNHQTTLDEEIEKPEDVQMVDSRQYMESFRDEIAMNLWNFRR